MAPPPDHHVIRIGNEPAPPAPPSLPEPEIIQRFSRKEDEYLAMRSHFTYKKTIRIEEFGPDGKPSAEYVLVMAPKRDADGKVYESVVQRPQSTMQHFYLRSEDLEGLERIPAFPLTTAQLANYNLKYLGKEQVDEVNCYIFQVKPKVLERQKAYFDGVVWVDSQYLEVVRRADLALKKGVALVVVRIGDIGKGQNVQQPLTRAFLGLESGVPAPDSSPRNG